MLADMHKNCGMPFTVTTFPLIWQ